jgi:pimeloyl-ACP methyl ester carboxylesterase
VTLEILSRATTSPSPATPILFVHGAYVGAWCWEEYFLDWFAAHGRDAHAVSLRGHGASEGHDDLDAFGLADYAKDVMQVAAALPRPPVLVGHSMGALVVQKYLEAAEATAVVLACPVPSFGLLASSFTLAFARPALFASLNAVATGGRASPEAIGQAFFGGTPEPARLERCYRRVQRESRRALLDMSGWGLPSPWMAKRPPTLVLGAEKDALIPAAQARGTANLLGAEYRELPALGHALMLDEGWETAAQSIAGWLEEKGF